MNVYITRQPIFDRDGSLYAYELLYRGEGEDTTYSEIAEDEVVGGVVINELFGIDVKSITGDVTVFINFTDDLIRQGAPRLFTTDVLVIEVTAKQLEDENILNAIKELKELGYTIAFDGFEYSGVYKEQFSLCDIVKIDSKAPREIFEEAVNICRSSNKLLLAKNANTNTDFEHAVKQGCKLLQGYFYARSSVMAGDSVRPLPVNLIEVMQLMAQPEPEIKDIVDVMSRDAALCQKILKLINSVYFGVSNKVSSINQAILILGLDYLREWVYLMGMQKISQNDSVEVMRLALLIAKFCRGLSELIPDTKGDGDAFYLMGLLSMIVLSSDRDLTRALDEFPLTNDIKKGLLRRGGTYSDVFEMALSFVDGRWDEHEYIARKYGLLPEEVSDIFIECLQEIGKLNMS